MTSPGLSPRKFFLTATLSRKPSVPTPLVTQQESKRRATAPLPPLSPSPEPRSPASLEIEGFFTDDDSLLDPPLPPEEPVSPIGNSSALPTPTESAASPAQPSIKFLLPKRETDSSSSESDSLATTINHNNKRHRHRHFLPSSEMSALAEVKVTKLKDCPMLTAGKITPMVLHTWTNACRRFMKHSGKEPEEIVSFIADAMLEPRLQAWYQSGSDRIDKLSLDAYIKELAELVLDKNWAHQIKQQILSAKQPDGTRFVDWRIEIENLNALLLTSSKKHAFTKDALGDLLEANTRHALSLKLHTNPTSEEADYKTWADTIHALDEELRSEDKRFEAKISAGKEKKSLLSRLSDRKDNTSGTTSPSNNKSSDKDSTKLTAEERALLTEFEGCTRCRRFFTDHRSHDCPMTKNNTWPDWSTYKPLTRAMALAEKSARESKTRVPVAFVGMSAVSEDYADEDTYVPSSTTTTTDPPPSFSVPHLYAPVEATGPAISEFPLSFKALLDIGCPSTVISGSTAASLGLHRLPLPHAEDNLCSLTEDPLVC
uniref:Uncharacterized protein n=1 Tax=Psilocybe cubensis TaxID=181762 RepID=A0A8H8CNN1_PSICU